MVVLRCDKIKKEREGKKEVMKEGEEGKKKGRQKKDNKRRLGKLSFYVGITL